MRSLIGIKKVGHAGTLDPFATGILLICTGKATKKVPQLMELTKEYWGQVKLGLQTDTDDITGKIINSNPVPKIDRAEFGEICQQFVGEIPQIPPMFSAKKIGGQRLYKIARKGKVVERPPKIVTISSLEIINFQLPFVTIKVTCSKGTYIRALARDIGLTLRCGAYLHSLTRTRIGGYNLEDSLTIEQFKEKLNGNNK